MMDAERMSEAQTECRTDSEDGFEIYIHVPFCVKKCAYCDFLSGPASEETMQAYTEALIRETRLIADRDHRLPPVRVKHTAGPDISGHRLQDDHADVVSVFIGGGTPSILPPALLDRIMAAIHESFTISPDAEITIEANPGTLSLDKLHDYRRMGINRLSIGLQSPDDRELKMLGRIHTWKDFLESYARARKAGFDNVNIDLMMALPGQTREGWQRNLRTAAELMPEHISAYSLIIEEGTPFAERELLLPDEDTEYAMYDDTACILEEYGLHQYEISNYARKGRECRHNVGYWIRRDYLGFGLGAASLRRGERWSDVRDMETYISVLSGTGDVPLEKTGDVSPEKTLRRDVQILSEKDAMAEQMFLGLRLTEGVPEALFAKRFGKTPEQVFGPVINKYINLGFLEKVDGCIRLTRPGIHVSNVIMSDFV